MAEPVAVRAGAVTAPEPRAVALSASLDRSAGRNGAYVEGLGRASGRRLTYLDAAAFVWWSPGGRLTLNRGSRGLTGTVRGVEDAGGRRA